MSVGYNPKLVTDGLVLCLDASNSKSYNQEENLYPNSESLSTFLSNPTGYSYTTTANGGPFGGFAATITSTDATNSYLFEWSNTVSLAAGETVTQSWYVKSLLGVDKFLLRFWSGANRAWTSPRSVLFTLSSQTTSVNEGPIVSSNITKLSNNWYRLSMTATTDQAGYSAMSLYMSAMFSVGSSFMVAAPQITKKLGPSKYTPTTGTAVSPTTVWTDISGYGTAGTLTNSPVFNSENGGCISYNGTTQQTTITYNARFNFNNEQTIGMWIKSTESDANRRNPYNQAYGGGGSITHEPGGSFTYYCGLSGLNSQPYDGFASSFTVAANELAYVTLTRDAHRISWYKNGVFSNYSVNPFNTSIVTGTENIIIGNGYAGYYQGNIAAIHLYTKCLSSSEVWQNFNALRGRFGI